MAFTRAQVRAELNIIFEDQGDNFWTIDQKNQAINYGIDSLWPELKLKKVVNNIVLVASTYIYADTGATDLTEDGYSICELQVTNAPYRVLRAVFQRPDPSKTGGWGLHIGEDIVDSDAGMKLKLWYHARHPRLAAEGTQIAIPVSTPVVTYAAMVLCTMFLPRLGHTQLDPFIRMIPQWVQLWKDSKAQNRVDPLPALVPIIKG